MALTEKGIETVKKWVTEKGCRPAGIKIIDSILRKRVGLTSSDLPDTAVFCNGLDGVEEMLESEEYQEAYNLAKETAGEMLQEENLY